MWSFSVCQGNFICVCKSYTYVSVRYTVWPHSELQINTNNCSYSITGNSTCSCSTASNPFLLSWLIWTSCLGWLKCKSYLMFHHSWIAFLSQLTSSVLLSHSLSDLLCMCACACVCVARTITRTHARVPVPYRYIYLCVYKQQVGSRVGNQWVGVDEHSPCYVPGALLSARGVLGGREAGIWEGGGGW